MDWHAAAKLDPLTGIACSKPARAYPLSESRALPYAAVVPDYRKELAEFAAGLLDRGPQSFV